MGAFGAWPILETKSQNILASDALIYIIIFINLFVVSHPISMEYNTEYWIKLFLDNAVK